MAGELGFATAGGANRIRLRFSYFHRTGSWTVLNPGWQLPVEQIERFYARILLLSAATARGHPSQRLSS